MMRFSSVKVPRERSALFSEVYQKKTQLEHVLLRPDTYVGSTVTTERELWVLGDHATTTTGSGSGSGSGFGSDSEPESSSTAPYVPFQGVSGDSMSKMSRRKIRYVPGLFKIFDEILVNAADNKQRDPSMSEIRVSVDAGLGSISVLNDGKGVPVVEHLTEKIPIPSLVFGHLLTGSNFDDSIAKVTGGRNGYGAKLTNIFSSSFSLETNDTQRGLLFKQQWTDNMGKEHRPVVAPSLPGSKDYTLVTFTPDLSRFGLSSLQDDDLLHLLLRRTYDLAACNPGVRVSFNGAPLPCTSYQDYVGMFPCVPHSVVFSASERWEVGIGLSETGQFEQVSFVNSVNTVRGGTHVADIVEPLTRLIADKISRKNTTGVAIMPAHIRNHLFVFVRCLIQNPSFDSQTKETLITRPASFGSRFKLTDAFVQQLLTTTQLQERVLSWAQFRKTQELSSGPGRSPEKSLKLYGIPKLDDANLAGGAQSLACTLILTEGDSAKSLAVSGLSILGRDLYGIFPLKGKLLNVREATHEQLLKNVEFNHLKRIMGLDHNLTYGQEDDFKSLRYGKIMLMTDQDTDGSHIKGLLINLIHTFWPALLKREGFLNQFITPIVKAKSGKQEKWFYNLPEYEQWKHQQREIGKLASWSVKYYKGLGTSTSAEGKDYFSNLDRHQRSFQWTDGDDALIQLVFAKSQADARKAWIDRFYSSDLFLDATTSYLTYRDFINRELILFSHADNVRSIPSVVDGLKPGQRKALFACFKRNLKQELKVAQLAGYISEHTGYHHGEVSLHSTIINMAQSFVGSNNLPLLYPGGQFGTRLQGGKDAASARYIFTKLNPLTRVIFPEEDDAILRYLEDDGDQIEPEYYIPIIPMLLVNGAEGIGTGWSCSIPAYHPLHIIDNIMRYLDSDPLQEMMPWYAGFSGRVVKLDESRCLSIGTIRLVGNHLKITELPVGKWTSDYKEFLDEMCSSKKGDRVIQSFKEHHSEHTVDFQLTLTAVGKKFVQNHLSEHEDLVNHFKLNRTLATTNMHAFGANGQLKLYQDPRQIIEEFAKVRLDAYEARRLSLLAKLQQEHQKVANRCRFAEAVVTEQIKVMNQPRDQIIQSLKDLGFDPKPGNGSESDGGFSYLLNTSIFDFSQERIDKLREEQTRLEKNILEIESTTNVRMYKKELRQLRTALQKLPQFKTTTPDPL